MKILNYGSLNIDYVYSVDHFVTEGETLSSSSMNVHCGGKGLNQSIALSKAGAEVYHAGSIGIEGKFLVNKLMDSGVNCEYITVNDQTQNGHAIIQLNKSADNAILLFGGANLTNTANSIESSIKNFDKGDLLLLQNEINNIPLIIQTAHRKGMKIAFNPAPITKDISDYPLEYIDYFILNEIEGGALSGEKEPSSIITKLSQRYPNANIVLTLGAEGLYYYDATEDHRIKPSCKVKVVDTTAAGDTFIGFFLAAKTKNTQTVEALIQARNASEIAITRKGAADSIPTLEEVLNYGKK